MDAHHVVSSLLLFVLVQIASSTDILVAYEHNVLLLRDAQSDNFSAPVPLVTPALHFPHGLAYRPGDDGSGGLVFVSDTQSGEASVFALELSNDHTVRHKEPIIKRSPQRLSHTVYNAAENSLFVSSLVPVPGVSRSLLSLDITKHWSPEPSLVTSAQIGTVRGITLDQCAGKLYWSETSNSSSSVSVLPTSSSSSSEARVLPLPNTSSPSFYQGLHYDETSKSLIIAVTDSDNYTTSSCRFISYREIRDTNEQMFISESSFNGLDYEVSIIAENISNCYPFALSTDQDYIYFSDWSRNGVMRLSKTDSADLVKLLVTAPSKSLGRLRFGAYDILALNDYELQWEHACSPSKSTSAAPSSAVTDTTLTSFSDVWKTVSSEEPMMKPVPVNNYQKDTTDLLPSVEKNKDRLNPDKGLKSFSPATRTTGVVVRKDEHQQLNRNLVSIVTARPGDDPKRHKDTRSEVASSDTSTSRVATFHPSVVLQYPDKFLQQNAYKIAPHSQNPLDVTDSGVQHSQLQRSEIWFPQLSREDLVLTIFVLLILCALLLVMTTLLSIRQLQSWRKFRSASCVGRLNNGRRAYEEVQSDPATRATRNQCAIDIEQNNHEGANGTTDLIIDLSSQDDIKVNSDLPASTGRRNKKKTFGPKNGSIKHLISKSFTKDGQKGSSTGCPGLQSSDGVTLNIEDCCQMTLCETPCYTSVRKEGKGYRSSGTAADEDQTTLLDDEQHTLC
ncbi:hypothetical protein FHG87_003007 [Trinorchestia longiramus]|nr:hypothetical protein FHG87_003007 [Trinorchestia longiramus]